MISPQKQLKYFAFVFLFFACAEKESEVAISEKQFTLLDPTQTNIEFQNRITDTKELNYLLYQYMYNGGGVAAADFNNDDLIDLYFTANQSSNKLYLNKGGLSFKDVTKSANVAEYDTWSTGVSVVDINADGWMDMYVCNSASSDNDEARANRFFINNQDGTFTDRAAEMGVADIAYSNQAYFFDYDKDDDLDMYLLNHRIDFKDNFNTSEEVEKNYSPLHSDKLYRNDGENFYDVTVESGILNHAWGLSASVGDFNSDGLQDIYVCNDFVQPDNLYINQGDGTFKDEIKERMSHISFYSMGSDYQDINNDGYPDLFVADMVSQDHERSIRNMAAMDAEEFEKNQDLGYHKQYMFNTMQLNMGNGEFADIAQLAGLAKTDWSWAPLIVDLDNDGFKDIFVTNGIKKDVTDIDYKEEVRMRAVRNDRMSFEEVFNSWPSTKLKNYAFKNNGDLTFSDVSNEWGLAQKQNSNGAIYADLDNDGDHELIVNNIDEPAAIYKNNSTNNFLKIDLIGSDQNLNAIAAKVEVRDSVLKHMVNIKHVNHGYLSSTNVALIIGMANREKVDNLLVSDGMLHPHVIYDLEVNMTYELDLNPMGESTVRVSVPNITLLEQVNSESLGLGFGHFENEFNDFEKEILLPHKKSQMGGCMAIADLNGDGLEDIFLGNAKDASPSLYLQSPSGKFSEHQGSFWSSQKRYEDQQVLVFDLENDGDLDLLVGSGGNENEPNSELHRDRLYRNVGNGNFEKELHDHKSNTTCFAFANDLLFAGAGVKPGSYPNSSESDLFKISNGFLEEINSKAISDLGIVNDALFSDFDNDGDKDLVVVGEWMPVTIIRNDNGQFVEKIEIENTSGWNYSIAKADFDDDGDEDLIIGNLGENNKFKPSIEDPLHVYANDFDENGTLDIVLGKEKDEKLLPIRGRECSSDQMPFIKDKFKTYTQYGKADLQSIYSQEKLNEALHLRVQTFSSMYLENLGDSFQIHRLPSQAQMGPTLSIVVMDANDDGNLDIIGAGNIYETEAETVSYDANRGYVLLGDGKGNFETVPNSGFYYNSNARDIKIIVIDGKEHLVLGSNNDEMKIFRKQ